jgi:spermidine synthase
VPRLYAERLPGVVVETVEIDPGVAEAARRWFGLPDRLAVRVDDGRRFLTAECGPYDVVAIDAYANGEVPVHLVTLEFFRLLKQRMAPDGVVITQVHGAQQGETSAFWRAVWRTLAAAFGAVGREHVRTQRVERVVLVASDGSVSGDSTTPPLTDVPLLTDAYAPVEALCAPLLAETFTRWQEAEGR